MENYKKGKNIEEPLERGKISINNLPEDFLWMQVRGGTKIRNVLGHAIKEFPDGKDVSVVWTGFGQSVGKAVTCAEIMKKEFKYKLHQITKLCYRTIDEHWEPLLSELDQVVVRRKLPMVHIYLSTKALNIEDLGYQAPGVFVPFKPNKPTTKTQYSRQNRINRHESNSGQVSKKY